MTAAAALAPACGPVPALSRQTVSTTATSPPNRVRAVAFDLFTLFDPRGVDRRVEELLPTAGGAKRSFATTWKSRLFQYSWIRTASGHYADFEVLVRDSLAYACRAHGVRLQAEQQQRLEASFTELAPWPDTLAALRSMKSRGLRLAPLANFSPLMIEKLLQQGGLRHFFDEVISTNRARTYKPAPRAYALGPEVLGLPRQQIAFSAFGGWDAAGARWFGYPTFWVNRLGATPEELISPDASGPDLEHLARWLLARGN